MRHHGSIYKKGTQANMLYEVLILKDVYPYGMTQWDMAKYMGSPNPSRVLSSVRKQLPKGLYIYKRRIPGRRTWIYEIRRGRP